MGGDSYLRVIISVILALNFVPSLTFATATVPDHILISEVATGTDTSATQEFIELYNPTDRVIDLSAENWRLKKSSGSDGASTTISLMGNIQPRGYYLLATTSWYASDATILPGSPAYWDIAQEDLDGTFSPMLSESGGHLWLVKDIAATDPTAEAPTMIEVGVDRLGWGTAVLPENADIELSTTVCNPDFVPGNMAAPVAKNKDNSSIRRCFNDEGAMIDSGNNAADFTVSSAPTPLSTPAPGLIPEDPVGEGPDEEEEPDEAGEPDEEPPPLDPVYLSLEITELLPDPTSPQTDARDEFVEIFNPNSVAVNLKDYVIQTGGNLQYSFKLPSVILLPGAYKAFYSREGKITLANSGGRVQLLAPDGDVASPLVKYPAVVTGESYALIKGSWAWTNQATPGKANLERKKSSDPTKLPSPASLQTAVRTSYPRLMITEVLPDPASPLKDAEDEFVEIYNPNTFAVNLKGYILRSGSTLKTKYALPDAIIKPGQYLVYFSDIAKLSLPNKGGSLRLEGENAQLIYEIKPYPKAIAGASWSLISGHWQWSAKPTPAAVNQAANTGKEESGSAGVRSAQDQFKNQDALVGLTAPAVIGPSRYSSIAVSVAAFLALSYLIYEFRHDLRSKVYLLRKRITSLNK